MDVDHPVSNLIEADGFVIASATDLGRKRTGNEDSHALWIADDAATRAERGLLLVVCDGMGGASAGEVASQLAVQTVAQRFRATLDEDPDEALRNAVELANAAVHDQATANAEQRGMGTTCTAVVLRGRQLWIGHVGDSRVYAVRAGQIRPLTRDHSLVAELVEKGHLSAEEAKTDHRRNVVTRSVGALDHVDVDAELAFDGIEPGDVFVVCSDGLHGQVSDAEIAAIASEHAPAEACTALIDLANERGGPDNITAIVVRRAGVAGQAATALPTKVDARTPGPGPEAPASAPAKVKGGPPPLGLLGIAAGVLLLLVVGVGALLFSQLKRPGDRATTATTGDTLALSAPGASEPSASPATKAQPTRADGIASPPDEAPRVPATEPAATSSVHTPAPKSAALAPGAGASSAPAEAPTRPPERPVGAGRPGTIRLMTRPFQPSTFSIDGQAYAQDVGFLTQSVPAGDHVVRVEGGNGGAIDVPVHVESGGSYSLVAELPFEGALGDIEIVLFGAGKAQVLIDGAQYPEPAPCIVRGLTPGSHTIRVMRPKTPLPQGPTEVVVTTGTTARAEYRFGASR